MTNTEAVLVQNSDKTSVSACSVKKIFYKLWTKR
jgi:hypothetical protein